MRSRIVAHARVLHPCGADDEMQDAKTFESGFRSTVHAFVIGLEHVKK